MKKKNIFFIVLFAVCALTCAIGLTACGGKNKIVTTDNGLELIQTEIDGKSGYSIIESSVNGEHIVIPDSYKGKPIIEIGERAFNGCSSIKSVDIPNSVTSIGVCAFSNCAALTSIEIPKSVTSIGRETFYGCDSLESMTLPFVGATRGGTENTFLSYNFGFVSKYRPPSLKTVRITDCKSIGKNAFYGFSGLTSIEIPESVTSIGDSAFERCSGLTSIDIPDGVTSIGKNAFYGCSGLTSIDIPDGVTSIGSDAFERCSGLTSIAIPNSVTSIGWTAFAGCDGLTSIEIPDSITSIDFGAFSGCDSLENITLPFVGATKDGTENTHFGYIFGGVKYMPTSLKSVRITGGESIGDNAFFGCSGLTSIEIPNSVTSIGDSTFSYCGSLINITIPNSVTSIGQEAFYGCSNLTSIEIPNSVMSIGDRAFENCDSLTSMFVQSGNTKYHSSDNCIIETASKTLVVGCKSSMIPSDGSVTSIGESAFEDCDGLNSIEIPNSVTSIGKSAFEDCDGFNSIEIPNSVTSIGQKAFYGCSSLESISLPFIGAEKDGTENTHFGYIFGGVKYMPTSLKSVRITGGESIGDNAFEDCDGLTSIEIPDSVTSIGEYAFSGCIGLTSIEIPNSVTSIGFRAFYGCNSIEHITLSFVGATKDGTENAYLGYNMPSSLKSVRITDGISIGEHAFRGHSSLTSIEIPDSVTSIGYGAFSGCYSLENLTLPFVGATKDGTENTHFGYIFGAKQYSDNADYVPSSLKTVSIVGDATSIGYRAFFGCNSLENLTLPFVGATKDETGNTHLGYIFGAERYSDNADYVPTSLKTVSIVGDATSIGSVAFYGCRSLASVEIPGSVTSIGEDAFYGCSGLTSIDIPNSVTNIGGHAFSVCKNLTNIEIPNSVTSIGMAAFAGCDGLTSIVIPDSVTSIGERAFYSCDSLTIYCEAASKPSNWNEYWNDSNCPVVWNYKIQ